MKLSTCLIQFFSQYLPRVKGVSERTIESYLSTFALFLPFSWPFWIISKINVIISQEREINV